MTHGAGPGRWAAQATKSESPVTSGNRFGASKGSTDHIRCPRSPRRPQTASKGLWGHIPISNGTPNPAFDSSASNIPAFTATGERSLPRTCRANRQAKRPPPRATGRTVPDSEPLADDPLVLGFALWRPVFTQVVGFSAQGDASLLRSRVFAVLRDSNTGEKASGGEGLNGSLHGAVSGTDLGTYPKSDAFQPHSPRGGGIQKRLYSAEFF